MRRIAMKPNTFNLDSASVRIRCLTVIRHFRSSHVSLELFEDASLPNYDAVIFSKTYSPECLRQAHYLKARGAQVILDLCDNHFYADHMSEDRTTKLARLHEMLSLADYVTVSSAALKHEVSRHSCSSTVVVIEDAVEERVPSSAGPIDTVHASVQAVLYKWTLQYAHRSKTRLIWFGANGSSRAEGGGFSNLSKVKDILHSRELRNHVVLTICTRGRKGFRGTFGAWDIPVLFVRWQRRTFYDILALNDIALLPININPFTICKTNNRVITALHNNLAVIADEIPSYTEFRGAIALNDWDNALNTLVNSPDLRATMVARGKAIIDARFTPAHIADNWRSFLESTMDSLPTTRALA